MWKFFVLFVTVSALAVTVDRSGEFQFAILGDRTGEAVPGVYEQTWRDIAARSPAFVVNVGDTIQGGNDATAGAEWQNVLRLITPYRQCPLFLVPGNHDVWSAVSAAAFEKYAKHPLHYSFDFGTAHFTVLDNSRTDSLPAEELDFLQKDLQLHRKQELKFVLFHRPSWIVQLVLANPNFALHEIAKKYGVQYVVCGHIHQMLHFQLDGVTYLSMASSGGHLRAEKDFQHGWFFGYTLVAVHGQSVNFQINELGAPFGKARQTTLADWGPAGLASDPHS